MLPIHYIRMRKRYQGAALGQETPATLQDLADTLYCSVRNVKLIIRKLVEKDWIEWRAGQGRGHHSSIRFLADAGEILMEEAKRLAIEGNLKQAMDWISEAGADGTAKEAFLSWLREYLGYRTEQEDARTLDVLRYPLHRMFYTLDPAWLYFSFEAHLIKSIFDTLTQYDRRTHTIHAHLAHYWEWDEREMAWTFHLRKGVLFHHGREMTAEDVRYTLERIRDPRAGSPHRWLVSDIKAIEVVDAHTVKISLLHPNKLFLEYISFCPLSIVPKDVYESGREDLYRHPVGTGAFRMVRNDENMMVLEAFDRHFHVRAHLDRIEYWLFDERELSPEEEGLLEGLIVEQRAAHPIPVKDWHWLEQLEPGCSLITYNLNKPGPLQNLRFRQLLDGWIDRYRHKMLRELGGKRVRPASGFLPGTHLEECPAAGAEETAKAVREHGYDGEILHMYAKGQHLEDAEWIRDRFAEIGVAIEVVPYVKKDMEDKDAIWEADMILYVLVMDEDAVLSMIEALQQENSYLRVHFDGKLRGELDEAVLRLKADGSKSAKDRFFKEVEERVRKHRAVSFLHHRRISMSYHPTVRGLAVNSLGWVDLKHIWFVRK